MTIDNNLLWVLVGTAGLSLLSLVYVLVDEGNKRRRYEQQKEKEAAQPPAVAPEEEAAIPTAPSPSAPEPVAAQLPLKEQETAPSLEDSALAQEPDTAPSPAEETRQNTP
ncbi:hypothetical protein [Synechococcus sp. OH20]|uniref:hypothetical protein n=1 Tax=Synechococcus sp. OH20 TaxID=139337 RepID=UPI0039C646AE